MKKTASQQVRLWARDERILGETKRSPALPFQLGRAFGITPKKMNKRLYKYYRAKLIKRTPAWQRGMRGRAPFVYFHGPCPSLLSLPHTLGIVDVRVECGLSFPESKGGQFFYGHELNCGSLRPDAALVLTGTEKAVLVFFEVDCGTERLTSPTSYSLLGKLRSYAAYFDSKQYAKDFAFAGLVRGFRVGVVLSSVARLRNVQRLLVAENLDFVLLTTSDELRFLSPIFTTIDGRKVDILGNPHG